MRRPSRGGHEVSIHVGLIDGDFPVNAAGERDLRSTRRIGSALPFPQHSGRRQQLQSVANRGDRLASIVERADDVKH